MSRNGVRPDDALEAVATAYAGQTLGQVYDHDRALDVVAILPEDQRARPDSLAALMLTGVDGTRVPLAAVAQVEAGTRRYSIQHESGLRRVGVSFNVQGRSASAVVADLRAAVTASVHLPERSFIGYAGVAEAEAAARHQLWLYAAMALGAIALALGVAFRRRSHALLVLANLPFALVGSIAAIAASGIGLSIGALVGLVTVFGISARNAILLLAHYEQLEDEGVSWTDGRLLRGARERLRPVLMTALVTALGMLPLALGLGRPGHEIEAPMAITVLGGLATSTLLTLILLPVLARRWAAR
jgi:Cu/Ag efflux pump CusA